MNDMRLGDLDKALEELCKYCSCGSYESCENRCIEFLDISNIPTIDAVPVVRCKDCKHMRITGIGFRWCEVWERIQTMGDDGFCNFGERKESNPNVNHNS